MIMGCIGFMSQLFFASYFFSMSFVIDQLTAVADGDDSLILGIQYSVWFLASIFGYVLTHHIKEVKSARIFNQLRKAVTALLYDKTLKISSEALA